MALEEKDVFLNGETMILHELFHVVPLYPRYI